jgi:hypothetical protein
MLRELTIRSGEGRDSEGSLTLCWRGSRTPTAAVTRRRFFLRTLNNEGKRASLIDHLLASLAYQSGSSSRYPPVDKTGP